MIDPEVIEREVFVNGKALGVESGDESHLTVISPSGRIPNYGVVASTAGSILLAFVLILCLWDTWSTFTDIVAPLNSALLRRSLLNLVLCSISAYLIMSFKGQSNQVTLLGNLLGGIGIWELTEGIIEVGFGEALVAKFFFYLVCLMFTYALVMYLEKTNRLNVMESGFLSPI